MKELSKFFKVYIFFTSRVAQQQLITNSGAIFFLLGKVLRFLLFFFFIFSIANAAKTVAGYSATQVMVFFMVFNIVDITTQFLFRGVYVFRNEVVTGNFDFDLLKPLPSIFRPIFGWTDVLDFITLIPLWIYFLYFLSANHLVNNTLSLLLFVLLLLNSLIIGFAFHLIISSLIVFSSDADSILMLFRDFTSMSRIPTDVYPKFIQYFLTFAVPVIVMITIPAKALFGIFSWNNLFLSFGISAIFLIGSLWIWNRAVRNYTSASS